MEFVVYEIVINNKRIYVGNTNNIKRRQSEHNNHCFKRQVKKDLYNYLREIGETKIVLNVIKEFPSKVDAKRYECYLILEDYFTTKKLMQKVPNISDRF